MATKADAPAPTAQLTGLQLYSRFALAGAVCCSVTHGALTPVDVYVPDPRGALPHGCRITPCDAPTAGVVS